jgi:hypothetical protein
MKDLFAENFENFWKNVVCERFYVFRKHIVDLPPPPPPTLTFHAIPIIIQLLDEVGQNIVICQWQADQLFSDAKVRGK